VCVASWHFGEPLFGCGRGEKKLGKKQKRAKENQSGRVMDAFCAPKAIAIVCQHCNGPLGAEAAVSYGRVRPAAHKQAQKMHPPSEEG